MKLCHGSPFVSDGIPLPAASIRDITGMLGKGQGDWVPLSVAFRACCRMSLACVYRCDFLIRRE